MVSGQVESHWMKIEAWINQKVIDLATAHRKNPPEVELSRPFGIASWRTRSRITRHQDEKSGR
jgi:hypothetical protein